MDITPQSKEESQEPNDIKWGFFQQFASVQNDKGRSGDTVLK